MMLLDYFGFLVGFLEKGTKSTNMGNFRDPYAPTQQRRSMSRLGMSMLRRGRVEVCTSRGYAEA